jgi:hypothetical protein
MAGPTEWVLTQKSVKIVVDKRKIEAVVVCPEYGPASIVV